MPKRVEAVFYCLLGITAISALIGGIAVGCSDDDGDDASPSTTPSTETSTTMEPPGTEPADVAPYIEDLLARLDAVTDQIVRDPTVVLEPDSQLIAEFSAIYAPESEGLAGGLGAFRASAEAGTHAEPLGSEPTRATSVIGPVEVTDEDHVTVPVCYVTRHRILDSDGFTLEHIDGLAQQGEVHAVRHDGEWRLERADLFENVVCAEGQA